ncbi:MAG: creatininase family protein, partial [Boseongicola sp.]|nr:creatininase family protein [Boseongicola sp.]
DMIVATGSWFGFADFENVIDSEALGSDIHAGDSETSAMLAARPELVDTSRTRNFVSANREWERVNRFIGLAGQPARPAWIIDDLNSDGACGDASAATAEKGRHLLDTAARNFALFLAEFARFDPRRHA